MLKKILSLTLCLCICLGVVISATSCGSESEKTSNSSSTDAAPTTLSFLGVTSEVTSQDAIEKVETALNDIFSARYKTKIDLTLVTENEYMKLIEERVEQAKYWQKYDESIAQYNAFIKNQANQTGTSTDKIFGNWIANDVAISLETLATRLIYVAEQTTVYEDGRVETLYPEATPIDIVMILDEEMYDEFSNMGLLLENGIDPNFSSYKTLQKYIYPTFFSELKNLKGVINAIPNNNLLAESTYLVVNKDVADAANFNIETFKNYADLADVLATAKSQGKLAPFKEVPEALGVFKLFSEDVAIGAYFDPMVGYNPDEGDEYAEYEIKNLFEIPQYVEHLELMETYTKAGYFSKANMANGYAVQVITGDASVYEKYSAKDSKYYVKEIQIPFVLREAIFDGMLAPTSYTESPERAMEIITAINTDPAVKNLLQYGIYEENYVENEADGTVIRLNTEYMMENAYTGNVYMGLLEADMGETSWAYVKQTNLASTNSPFLLFSVDENYLKSNLKKILQDAALAEVLADMGLSFDAYRNASGSTLVSYNGMLKNAHKDFFINKLIEDSKATTDSAEGVFAGSTVPISWYEEQIANKIISEKYSHIQTLAETDILVSRELSTGIVSYVDYENARKNAEAYIENIESLKVITRITLFNDLTDAEYNARYGKLDMAAFETAVYNYVRDTFIKENNLTDEDYEKLVQDFIAVEFKFTNANKVEYTYTWEDFEKVKANSKKFSEALANAKVVYAEMLKNEGISDAAIEAKTDVELADVILETIRMNYFRSKNYTPEAFKTNVYNTVVLKKYNITYDELTKLKNTDNEKYKSYLKTIKKDYKKQLLELYTKEEYELLADNKALTALGDYYVEYYAKAEASLCEAMGLSKAEFKDLYYNASEYIKCVEKMRKSFLYTLRTMYDDSYLNTLKTEELEEVVYGAVYNSGYYMNQVAQCIGVKLSNYNSAKADATSYINYLYAIIENYKTKLQAKGYDITELKSRTPAEIEEIICGIIKEEKFSGYKTLDAVIEELCKDKVAGIETTYTNIGDYCKTQAEALSENYLYQAVVNYLNNDFQATLEANKTK